MSNRFISCWIICYGNKMLHYDYDGVIIGTEEDAKSWCSLQTSRLGLDFWYMAAEVIDVAAAESWMNHHLTRYYRPWIDKKNRMMLIPEEDDEDEEE